MADIGWTAVICGRYFVLLLAGYCCIPTLKFRQPICGYVCLQRLFYLPKTDYE